MLCRDSKKVLGAFVDNEIDLMQSVALEEHLASCADCTAFMEGQRAVKDLLKNGNFRFSAPPGFKEELLRELQPPPPKKLRLWSFTSAPVWRAAAAAAIIILSVGLITLLYKESSVNKMAAQNEIVDSHIRSLLMNHLTDVASTDQHTVKPWFNGKLAFSPKVVDFSDKGFPLIGGRLDTMDGQTVAALIYRHRQHVINVFTYPHSGAFRPLASEQRGYRIIHWAESGMEFWLVSDLNPEELEQFAELLRE
ncbi:MAG TPA: anti-sigma factor [Candidatus Solibacter sp.]|jgi:anti-sigma factor RsiW|nr:anti-sigma factor [Candidatus Solibacter sp.]